MCASTGDELERFVIIGYGHKGKFCWIAGSHKYFRSRDDTININTSLEDERIRERSKLWVIQLTLMNVLTKIIMNLLM